MRRLTSGILSEKCFVRRFRCCAKVIDCIYANLDSIAIWYNLLFLGYKPVQSVTVLDTLGNCNTMVSITTIYYNIKILWDHRLIRCPSLTETL